MAVVNYQTQCRHRHRRIKYFESSNVIYCCHKKAVIQVGVAWPLYVKISTAADIVDRLVVDHERAVAVLESCVRAQGGVVGLHHGCGYLGSWVDAELQLRLLPVVDREALHQE